MKRLFCYFYKLFLVKLVDSEEDFLVKLIDAASGSSCKYCLGIRQWLNGFGVGVLFTPWWIGGVCLIGLAYLMTLGEKRWICKLKKD